jgi:hypothetical protein
MRLSTLIFLLAVSTVRSWSQCESSLSAAEKAFGSNFIAEPHYLQGMLMQGDSLSFQTTWLADNTYRIATSSTELQRIKILVFDQNNNIVFNSSEFNYPSQWDFFIENSMAIRCVIRSELPEPTCVAVLTGFKK